MLYLLESNIGISDIPNIGISDITSIGISVFNVLPILCSQDDAVEIMKMTEHGIYEEPSKETHGNEENHYENSMIADEKVMYEKSEEKSS